MEKTIPMAGRRRIIARLALGATLGLFFTWMMAYRGTEPPPEMLFQQQMPPGLADNVRIADPDMALTFARFQDGGALRLIRVEAYVDGMVDGVLLDGTDPIALFNAEGYDALAIRKGQGVRVAATDLTVPFDGTANQIAIGVNYPAHKAEADMEEPFLFPKLSRADGWMAPVPAGDGLLDYEVELGFVALGDLSPDAPPQTMGLILAADYSDRATLLRRLNLLDPESGDGFTEAKSRPGFMPVGNMLVIPRNLRRFYGDLRLQLFVDGRLRQVARPRDMVWQLDRMLAESRDRAHHSWPVGNDKAILPVDGDGVIPARTMVLSGTTDGVVFRPPSGRQIFIGVMETLFSPLSWTSWRDGLVERAIHEAELAGHYMQPGQEIVMHADLLGVLRNRIVDGP